MAENYKITDQRQTSRLKSNGGFEDGMEVAFTAIPSNVSAQEFIPLGLYTPEHVDQILTQRAQQINTIQML